MSEPRTSSGLAKKPARLFPWFCPKCRRQEVRRATIRYQCERLHEAEPICVILENFSLPRCGHWGELVFDYEAEEQINQAYEAQINGQRRGQAETATQLDSAGSPDHGAAARAKK